MGRGDRSVPPPEFRISRKFSDLETQARAFRAPPLGKFPTWAGEAGGEGGARKMVILSRLFMAAKSE
jgi:hypothetical protein